MTRWTTTASPTRLQTRRSFTAIRDLGWGWKLAFDANRSRALSWLLLSTLAGLAPMGLLLAARLGLQALTEGSASVPDTSSVLGIVVGATALVYLLGAVVPGVRARLASEVQAVVLDRLLEAVSRLPLAFFDRRQDQDLLHRARNDALAQPALIFEASGNLLQTGLFFAAIATFLALQSWLYPALLLGAAVPAVAIFGAATVLAYRTRRRDTFLQRVAAYLLWTLTDRRPVPETRMTGAFSTIRSRYAEVRQRLGEADQQRERYDLRAKLAAGVAMLLSIGIGVGWMLRQYGAGAIGVGDLAVSFYAFVIAHRLAGTLLEAAARLYRGGLFLGDLRHLLSLDTRAAARVTTRAPLPPREGIAIRSLDFAYPGSGERVFENLSLDIPAGEISLLVGPNGRGKSTLLKLIAGLYAPSAGSILIDGVALGDIDPLTWRAGVSFMFQDPARFAGSLRDNVELGRPGTERSWELARAFGQLDSLLEALPNREHTALLRMLGGHDLSEGEWQRIALARAIATDAPVLILDEPTSALDPASRERFWADLPGFAAGRTVVIASHDAAAIGKRIDLAETRPQ